MLLQFGRGITMARQRVVLGLFAAICAPVLGFSPTLANAAYYEINVGGIGYNYGGEEASNILKDSPYRTPGATQYYINKEADYPNTGTDASITTGAASALALIRNICSTDSDCEVSGFGGSNGADVLSELNDMLMKTNDPLLQRLKLYLMVNPRDPYGGVAAKLPKGMTVPLTSITAGSPTQPGGAYIVSIRDEYDPISDFPVNLWNLVADFNAFVAFFKVHPQVNSDVTDPRNIVTTSADGRFTSILVHTEVLPMVDLLSPFLPREVIKFLDMLLRPIVDSAYTRPGPSVSSIQTQVAEPAIASEPQASVTVSQQRVSEVQQSNEESGGGRETIASSQQVAPEPLAVIAPAKTTEPAKPSAPIQEHEATVSQVADEQEQTQQHSSAATADDEETKSKDPQEEKTDPIKPVQPKANKPSLDSSEPVGHSTSQPEGNQPKSANTSSGSSSSSSGSSSSASNSDAGDNDS
jgi:hypothetical protein